MTFHVNHRSDTEKSHIYSDQYKINCFKTSILFQFFFFFFFLGGWGGGGFHLYQADRSSEVGENWRTRGKNI